SYANLEPPTWALALLGRALSAADFANATRYLQRVGRGIGTFFEKYDVLLTPTLASPPVLIGSLQPPPSEMLPVRALGRLNAGGLLKALGAIDSAASKVFDFIPYTPLFNA